MGYEIVDLNISPRAPQPPPVERRQANPRETDYSHIVEEFTRDRKKMAGKYPKVARVALVLDSTVHDTPRHFAAVGTHGRTEVRVAPELAAEPVQVIRGVLRHELGHCVVLFGHKKAAQGGYDAQERQADEIAGEVFGTINYDSRGVQTTGSGTSPRPKGLK